MDTTVPAQRTPPNLDQRAESMATHLCNVLMEYCRFIGLSTDTLSARTGVSKWTIRGLRHRRIKNYPQLLNFTKLVAAADLELMLVRVQQGLDPTPENDPAPPPYYNTGTEGDLRWPAP